MQFHQLLKQAQLTLRISRGQADITDVQIDSRRCRKGSCFVAVRGWTEDGHKYIPAAIAAGASAVVCEDFSAVPEGVPCAVVGDAHLAAAYLAQAVNDWPARKLKLVGITGTKGKSTTTYLVRAVLEVAGFNPALLGTISYEIGARSLPSCNTTPDSVLLAEMTAEMVASGKSHLVMEVSSHALHQGRVAGLDFSVGVFTNLSGDHLDYHKTMEEYMAAKRLLFESLRPDATAVINRDDPVSDCMAQATRGPVIWYGLNGTADLRAKIQSIDESGTHFLMSYMQQEVLVVTRLIGRHNVYNCLAAAGACLALGVELPVIAKAFASVTVPGRLEPVDVQADYKVFVDYAHTDDSLAKLLTAMKPITRGRIIVVFGCGGDRDRTKRPRMAKVAEEMADAIIITSDNPRCEDPGSIIDEICAGFSEQGRTKCHVECDRRKAIEMAISQACSGDVVLLAGKGHEKYQIIGKDKVHFDDVEEAMKCMKKREHNS